jgi:hypothetical protein
MGTAKTAGSGDVFGKPAPGHQKGMLRVLNFAFVAAHNRSSLNREWSGAYRVRIQLERFEKSFGFGPFFMIRPLIAQNLR